MSASQVYNSMVRSYSEVTWTETPSRNSIMQWCIVLSENVGKMFFYPKMGSERQHVCVYFHRLTTIIYSEAYILTHANIDRSVPTSAAKWRRLVPTSAARWHLGGIATRHGQTVPRAWWPTCSPRIPGSAYTPWVTSLYISVFVQTNSS